MTVKIMFDGLTFTQGQQLSQNYAPAQVRQKMRRARAKRAEERGGEELSPCVKRYLSKFFSGSVLKSITWERGGIPAYVPIVADAFTLGNHIYFDPKAFTDGSISDEEMVLLAHEITHVRQNHQNGFVRQSVSYLLEAVRTGTLYVNVGPTHFDFIFSPDVAEQASKYEREARDMAERVRADLEKNGNPCK